MSQRPLPLMGVLACLALLPSCAPPSDPNLTFAYEGSHDGLIAAQCAAAEWNKCSDISIVVERDIPGMPLQAVPGVIRYRDEELGAIAHRNMFGHVEAVAFADVPGWREEFARSAIGFALGLDDCP